MGNNPNIPSKITDNLILLVHLNDTKGAIKFLDLHKDINVNNTVNKMGDSLLHYAAYKNNFELVDYLMSKGANPRSKNSRGLTPLDLVSDKTTKERLEKGA